MQDAADQLEDGGAFGDSEGFTEGLSADCEAGDKGGDGQGQGGRTDRDKGLKAQDDNGSGRTGDDAADIANDIVAEAGDFVCFTDEAQCLACAGDFAGRHRVEGFFIGGGNGNADDIEEYAQEDEGGQDGEGGDEVRAFEGFAGGEAEGGGEDDGNDEDLDSPTGRVIRLFCFFVGFLFIIACVQAKISSLSKYVSDFCIYIPVYYAVLKGGANG